MAQRTVAFFGSTSGCVCACIALTLQAGHRVVALARSPSKLTSQLQDRGIAKDVLDMKLETVQGNVKDIEAVTKVLQGYNGGVDTIINGIGGSATPQLDFFRPLGLTDPHICSDTVSCILDGLRSSDLRTKPLLIVISANGVLENVPRDYPLLMTPVYGWLLRAIFDDKRAMETTLSTLVAKGEGIPIAGYVSVRPSTLLDSPGKGMEAIRQGTTQAPTIGYSISREDVGLWMFEKLIKADDREALLNDGVTLTY